jgi:hypothetical protein
MKLWHACLPERAGRRIRHYAAQITPLASSVIARSCESEFRAFPPLVLRCSTGRRETVPFATGRDRDGREWPSRRDPRQALSACQVASEFLEQSPPCLYPSDKGFRLSIAEPHWARPWAADFFAAQEIDAARLFVGILADEWLERLCKCRYAPCGKYFVGAKIRRSYRHGTFCTRAHRARASADAFTKARRQRARCALASPTFANLTV